MLRSTAIAGAIVALAVCGLGTAGASAKSGSGAGTCRGAYVMAVDDATLKTASDALLCLVNRERATRGLGAMRTSGKLATAAKSHSGDMVAGKYFSHTGLDGDDVSQRVSRTGYPWTAVAETMAYGAAKRSTPSMLVATMMKSGMHRSILLQRRYRELGVGLVLGAPTRGARGAASTLTLVFGSR